MLLGVAQSPRSAFGFTFGPEKVIGDFRSALGKSQTPEVRKVRSARYHDDVRY